MKRVSRLHRAFLAPSLLFVALCACGGPSKEAPPAQAPGAAPAQPVAAPAAEAPQPAPAAQPVATPPPSEPAPSDDALAKAIEPWKGDLDGMVARRYVRFLVTFSKTNYFLDKGAQMGVTYDAGKAFEDFLNAKLKTGTIKVNVAFIPVRRDQLFKALQEGRGDVAAASLTITPERMKLADFAAPLMKDVHEVVVTGQGVPLVPTADDLSGREVYVRRSSSYFEHLQRLNAALAKAGKAPVKVVEADEQLEDEDILEMVNAGLEPATVVDQHLADFWAQVFNGLTVNRDAAINTDGEIAWAVRPGSPKLKALVDEFARASGKGTKLGNIVLQKYLKSADYVKNSASPESQRKFRDMLQFFRKYGDQYDIPFLLLAAQGYQESQLDQNRKSHVGAVGIMQVKPETAAGHPVYIKDVDKSAEANIHAGAKYLRWIVDEYYKNEPMTRLDKGLFALASYNAGAGRISGLRRKAQRLGLDPNQWFQNVEVVVARDVGRETVQYVSNIYKYYVSYNLVAAQRESKEKTRKATS